MTADDEHAARPIAVVVCSYGTEGDNRPLVALASRLAARGHDVTLLLEADGVALARARGLRAEPLAGDLRRALSSSGSRGHAATTLRLARRHTGDWARTIRSAAERADVVVGSGLAAEAAQVATRAAEVPFVGISMFPVVPTAAFPPPLLPVPLPPGLNRPAHVALQKLLWRMLGRQLEPVRRQWGLPPVPLRFDDHPTLCAVSPTLLPTPADWPPVARVTGDLHDERPTTQATSDPHDERPTAHVAGDVNDDRTAASLDDRLLDFLHAGPPPVYVGFGSMTFRRPERVRAAVADLATSHRVVFAPGWSGISLPSGPTLLTVGAVPHDLLFPHLAAVVHHGGAGTVHAAARAGVPQVVVPFAGDQAWWARRIRDTGIGTSLRSARLTGPALSAAVRAADELRPGAAAVADEMSREDGCGTAVTTVEQVAT